MSSGSCVWGPASADMLSRHAVKIHSATITWLAVTPLCSLLLFNRRVFGLRLADDASRSRTQPFDPSRESALGCQRRGGPAHGRSLQAARQRPPGPAVERIPRRPRLSSSDSRPDPTLALSRRRDRRAGRRLFPQRRMDPPDRCAAHRRDLQHRAARSPAEDPEPHRRAAGADRLHLRGAARRHAP